RGEGRVGRRDHIRYGARCTECGRKKVETRSIPDEESGFCAEKNIHPIASERMDSIVNNTVERRERFHGRVAHSDHPTASTSDLPDCRNQPKDIAVAMCVRALVLRGEARL